MLEKLRAKPEHVKKSIALSATSVIFGIVFLAWVSSWDARQNEEQAREQAVSPLAGFTQMIKGITADVKDSYSSMDLYDGATTTQTIATTSSRTRFDMASVVILDPSVSLATTTATTTTVSQ